MIKGWMIALILIGTSKLYAQKLNLDVVRSDFNKGVKDEVLCKKHLDALKAEANTPVERGYEAAFHMFMAKHTSNPFKKMSYFKTGRNMLEKEIKGSPNNVELRFIRLCIQYYIPKYLGYHHEVEQDKEYVMNNLYKMQDKTTKDKIYKYLKGANMYNASELALLAR